MYIAFNSVKELAVSFAIFSKLEASKGFKIEFLKKQIKQKARLNMKGGEC